MPKIMKSMRIINRCQNIFRSDRAEIGLCGAHHVFVYSICNHPGRSQEQLASDLYLDKSTVARALTHLENDGFVERIPNAEDKRQLLVYPTQKMKDILPAVRRASSDWNALLTEGIDEESLSVFTSVLLRLEENAKQIIEKKGANGQK